MDSYNFTYKDVLKRYERIINKPSKLEIRLLATILLIITIVNISSLCFADEGDFSVVNNLSIQTIDSSTATFVSTTDNINVYYTYLQKGHSYRVTFNRDFWEFNVETGGTLLYILNSADVPSNGVNANIIDKLTMTYTDDEISVDFLVKEDSYYYFCVSARGNFSNRFSLDNFQLEDISSDVGQIDAVQGLVQNVGVNKIWEIFDTSIGFVGVVVIAAFGIFLIVIAIRKMQKGKSEF